MSLENAIAELNAAINTNNDLLRQVLAADAAKGGDAGEAADKPKATRGKKADDGKKADEGKASGGDDLESSLKTLKDGLAKWLSEFVKESDKDNPDGAHPEVGARKAALSKAFGQLQVKNLKEVTTAEQVEKLRKWLEKVKVVDKGFGVGRLVADPAASSDEEEDDDLAV